MDRIWNFFTRQQMGSSSTVPPDSSPFEDQTDEDEEDDTPNLFVKRILNSNLIFYFVLWII